VSHRSARLVTNLLSIGVMLCFSFSITLSASGQAADEMALRGLAEKFFAAYQKPDLDALMLLWSEKSPAYATSKLSFQQSFAANKIEVKSLTLGKLMLNGEKASLRVGVDLSAVDGKTGKPADGFGKMNRTLHFINEGSVWKVLRYVSSEEELAVALVEAKTESERKQLLGADKELVTVALVQALLAQGRRLFAQSKHSQVIAIFSLAGEIANQLGDKKSSSTAFRGIGAGHHLQSNYTQALEYYFKSLRLAEEIGDKTAIALTVDNIGLIHQRQSNYTQAMEYFKRSLRLAEEIGDKSAIAYTLSNIGDIHQRQSNHTQALEHYQKSLRLAEEIGDKNGIANTVGSIGHVYQRQSNYTQALEYYQRGLKLAEETGSKSGISSLLNSIGTIHQRQGNYTQALEDFHKSLKIKEEIGDKGEMALTLGNIGNIHLLQGNYTQALEYYFNSLKIKEETGDKRGIGTTLGNIGNIHHLQGNYTQALEYYQRGLKLAEEIGNKGGIAHTVGRIGLAHKRQGNNAQALEYYLRSLRLAEEIGDKSGISSILLSIGALHHSQGNYTQALEDFHKSLKIAEEIGEKAFIGYALSSLGRVHQSQGNHKQAVASANRAADLAQQLGSPEKLWEARIVAGQAYQALNQPDEAKKAFADAISAIEETRNQIAGNEQQQQQFFAEKLAPYYGMVSLLIEQNNNSDALDFAERAKARALLDVLQTGKLNITKAMSLAEKHQEQKFNSELVSLNAQIYTEKLRSQPDQARLKDLNTRLQKARLDLEAFQTSLYAAHPELKVQRGQTQTLSLIDAAALIPDDKTALLEFVVSEDQTFLFVLTKNKSVSPSAADLKVYRIYIKQKELAKLCQEFRQRLADRRITYQDIATQLYDLLLKPARISLVGKTNLLIVPDGVLWELPFQALQSRRDHFLIEDSAISYAPSLTVLHKVVNTRQTRSTTSATSLLAVGNPIVAGETSTRVKSVLMDEQLLPLPEAERQVKLLEKLYTASHSKVYVGQAASEQRVKAEAGGSRILHLATHGILNDASPMYSQIVLARSPGDSNEDGLLEAWEIMNMELKADLVVLSACETARGKLGAGEGMIGLSWALFVAGSPATVVSQWKVESASTTELMVEFHRNLRVENRGQRMTKSDAMRRAALKLLKMKDYRHPFYWAAFVIIGDAK
jgi:CHAT domain-containing protein